MSGKQERGVDGLYLRQVRERKIRIGREWRNLRPAPARRHGVRAEGIPDEERVVSGEMPILLDYDFNAYRAKYSEKGNFEFVIPCEGSVVFPYVVGLVKNAPDKAKAEKVLDYLLSDKGQAIWTNAYLRPARPIELPEAVKKKFLPDSDYARARSVDWGQMENVQKGFVDRYLAEVR